jgi:chromosomal replication initiation ATPase DnaA
MVIVRKSMRRRMSIVRRAVNGPRQIAFGFDHRPSLTDDDFLVTSANRDAVAWLDAWPNWPAPALVIYGPVGSGKSHLGQVFRARTQAIAISPKTLGAAGFADLLANARECLIDDADTIADTEALLHLYNAVAARGGHILMTARKAPAFWQITLLDLRSRLLSAPAAALGRPDDELIKAVLGKLFSDRQVRVDVDVVEYLARRMERSLTEAQRLVAAIDQAALAAHREVTVPFVRDLMLNLRGEA